jgi:lipid II:glycine glycyltransferase (peptidoglycan interpeptide bridge formation enzyme)
MNKLSLSDWNAFLSECRNAHLLQTAPWGELKSNFGWQPVRIEYEQENMRWGAQILFRQLPLGFTFAYLPKGPLFISQDGVVKNSRPGISFWREVDSICQEKRAVFLKVEPDDWAGAADWQDGEIPAGFETSHHSIQPASTIVVDLQGDEDEILRRMKQKTRYNIRLAIKKGVQVRASSDVTAFYNLMEATGERDQFGIHTLDYYQRAFDLFDPGDQCKLLLADYEGEPIAGLMVFVSGNRSWYLYGASASSHRERMPTYLLQWEAMKWARAKGCSQYDLYGVPDFEEDYLETNFQNRSDGLWGIYRFKRGFGGRVVRARGAWDRVYIPFLYQIYLRWLGRNPGNE